MTLNQLTAVSPIDGRYRSKTERLSDYFSEYALIRYRVRVECEYFTALMALLFPEKSFDIRFIWQQFSEDDARRVKEFEAVTNHDVSPKWMNSL